MSKPPHHPPRGPQAGAGAAPQAAPGHSPLSEAINPVTHLVGHSLAAAIGFALMALVALIPLGTLKILELAGVETLKEWMEPGEHVLLYTDSLLSGLVFLTGVLHFLVDLYVDTERRIIASWKRRKAP